MKRVPGRVSTAKDEKAWKPELLSCPFCGERPIIEVSSCYSPREEFRVICSLCRSGTQFHDMRDVSVRRWNDRTRADAEQGKLMGSVRVRMYGGTYMAQVRIGTTTYRASSTSCEDYAAKAVATKVQQALGAGRITLSMGTPGADTGTAFAGETHYMLTVFENVEGGAE